MPISEKALCSQNVLLKMLLSVFNDGHRCTDGRQKKHKKLMSATKFSVRVAFSRLHFTAAPLPSPSKKQGAVGRHTPRPNAP